MLGKKQSSNKEKRRAGGRERRNWKPRRGNSWSMLLLDQDGNAFFVRSTPSAFHEKYLGQHFASTIISGII